MRMIRSVVLGTVITAVAAVPALASGQPKRVRATHGFALVARWPRTSRRSTDLTL